MHRIFPQIKFHRNLNPPAVRGRNRKTRNMSEKHLTNQRFTEFTLESSLQQGLRDADFTFCTPIQAACLPAALEGRDVAGQAQTGTGKTVAFLLACCHYLLTRPPRPGRRPSQPRALILAPTRELAIQIYRDARVLAGHTGFSLGLVYGGTGYDEQRSMLAGGADILIGTPGRLIDFFKQGLYDLSCAQVAVLDEADRMFDLGFIRDIRFLLRRMPAADKRLNLLFSATLSFKVMELAYEHMNDPEEIKIETDTVVVEQVTEYSFYPAQEEKLRLLVNLLKRDPHQRIMVFVNTRHAVERVAEALTANGIRCGALSGDVPQQKRERLLEAFKAGERKVLVATDVAARGLHIPAVSHVYNFDLPQDADDYIHRIGRTARAGASGEAISFVCERYAYSIMDIEETIGHALPRRDISADLLAPIAMPGRRMRREDSARGERGREGFARGRESAGRGDRGRDSGRDSDSGRGPEPSRGPARRGNGSSGVAGVAAGPATGPAASPATGPAASPVAGPAPATAPATPIPAADSAAAIQRPAAGPAPGDSIQRGMTGPAPTPGRQPPHPAPPAPMAPQFAAPQVASPAPSRPPADTPAPRPATVQPSTGQRPLPSAPPAGHRPPRPPANSTPPAPPAVTRFSRRYGEVPAVG